MPSMTMRAKLVLLIAIPILVLIALTAVGMYNTSQIKAGVDTLYNDRVVPLKQLKTISDMYGVNIIDAVNKANAGIFTAEEAQKSLTDAKQTITTTWAAYMATTLTEDEAALAKQADELYAPANQSVDKAIAFLSTLHGNVSGQLNDYDGPLYKDVNPVSSKIDDLVNLQLNIASKIHDDVTALHESTSRNFLIGTIITILVLLALGYAIYQSINTPVKNLRDAMEKIATISDLTIRSKINSDDEIGSMAKSFDKMINAFQDVISNMNGIALSVASASEEMAAISVQSSQALHNQRGETTQAATAMHEMVATVQEIASNASTAADAASQADKQSKDGKQVVSHVMEAIDQLTQEISETAQVIQRLDNDSQNIGKVLDVIRGIAEQTNLLALNAAIEAARAGEQGRGFAVVADEVRTLAQRTQNSTKEIQEMIAHLQEGTNLAVAAMEKGKTKAGASVERATQAGAALEIIEKAVGSISGMNIQIASAAEEQTSVANEINRNINTINEASSQISEAAEQSARGATDLAELATNLQTVVARFVI